jgi:hypothetical protein
VLMSSGEFNHESHHPSSHWPYSDRFKDAKCVSRGEILNSEDANNRRLSNARATP